MIVDDSFDRGSAVMPDQIIDTGECAYEVTIFPRVAVEVSIGTATVMVTAAEARRAVAVLLEAADRIERGDGFAR